MAMNANMDDTETGTLRQSKDGYAGDKLSPVQSEWGPPPSVARLSGQERIAAERKLKRKIDFRLMPILVIMYILSTFTSHALLTNTRLSRPKCDCQYATCRDHSGSQSCWRSVSNSRLHSFRGVKTHLSVSPLIQVTF